MKIKERIRPLDSRDNSELLERVLSRVARQLQLINRDYLPVKGERFMVSVTCETRESRLSGVKHGRSPVDLFDFDLNDPWYIPDYSLSVTIFVDTRHDLAEMAVKSHKLGHKTFTGTQEQVSDLLDFISSLAAVPILKGEKVLLIWSTDDIFMSHDDQGFGYEDGFGDGWSPDSPEQCSDTEKEVFFPDHN